LLGSEPNLKAVLPIKRRFPKRCSLICGWDLGWGEVLPKTTGTPTGDVAGEAKENFKKRGPKKGRRTE